MESAKKGDYYWNEAIHPEIRAVENINAEDGKFKTLFNSGFGFVSPLQNDGIVQGTSPMLILGTEDKREFILNTDQALHFSFNKGVSQQTYPSSLMGSIALLRQAMYDREFYKQGANTPSGKQSMEPWLAWEKLPAFLKLPRPC